VSIRGDCRVVVAHDDVCEQGYDIGWATGDGVIVGAAFALRVAGLVYVLDVLGD